LGRVIFISKAHLGARFDQKSIGLRAINRPNDLIVSLLGFGHASG
jgi:hypothetical protein